MDNVIALIENNSISLNVLLILGATILLSLLSRLLIPRLARQFSKTVTPWDDAFIKSIELPLQLLIWILGISIAISFSGVSDEETFNGLIQSARDIGVILAITWFLIRFIKLAEGNVVAQTVAKQESIDDSAVNAIGKLSRLGVLVIASLVAMQTLGISIAGILTFGGVGGIAIGFAAKDLLSNFFGGLFIYLDRPFKVGDWISSPDRSLEGTVEHIGWRVTRIRKFDSQPIYVPNSAFSTITVQNPSRQTNRRISETIGIRYDDANKIENIVAQVSSYLKSHEAIDQQQSVMVNFSKFAPSSLDFSIYCFTKTVAWAEYNNIKQEVLLRILNIIEENGAQCAFPTTTVHLAKDTE